MNITQLLALITQLTLILISLIKLVDFVRRPDRTRFDIFLMFGNLAMIVIFQLVRAAIGGSIAWLGLVESAMLMAHPYLLLRLVQHLRPISRRLRLFALMGLIISWILIFVFPVPRPVLTTELMVVYFAFIEIYAALALVRGALTTSGVTHWRLLLAASGSILIAAVILIAGVLTVFQGVASFISPFSQLVALFSVLSYYFGFATPGWLRRSWQLSELYRFLRSRSRQIQGELKSETLERLGTAAKRAVGGSAAFIALWDEKDQQLRISEFSSLDKVPPAFSLNREPIQRAWQDRQPALLTYQDETEQGEHRSEQEFGVTSVLVVPIATQEYAWGLLLVLLLRAPLFVSDDLDLLSLFSEQTAIALGYVGLLGEQQSLIEQLSRYNRRLETVNEIDRAILSARSTQQVAHAALSHLRELAPSQRASVVLYDFEQGTAHFVATSVEGEFGPPEGSVLPLEDFPPREALQKDRTTHYIEDLSVFEPCPPALERLRAQGIRSLISTPLIAEGELIGELGLSSTTAGAYVAEHMEIAGEVANQLAITIQQARLREELQRYAAELEQRVDERTAQLAAAVEDLQEEIAARKLASDALRDAQDRLKFLVSATPAIIYSAKASGSFETTFVSENVALELGYEASEFLEDPNFWTNHVHPSDLPAVLKQVSLVFERSHHASEYRFRHKNGHYLWMLDEFRLIRDAEGNPFELVGYWIDITQRKEAEGAIEKLNQDLQQRAFELDTANRELEAFAYSVSHDLRAPLRAIDGFSRILLTKHTQELSEEAQRYLDLVRINTQQMGLLIDDLLSFSRLSRQALNKQLVEPGDLARLALKDLLRDQEERSVEVSISELPACYADPGLLKQVFVNLLSNALKFTSQRETACIEVGLISQNGEQIYYVKDNGVGFDMQYAGKLFGVFQRLHRTDEFEGTGVGLAIVQRIISRHGGRVWAEGEIDKGATFYFTLPGPLPG